MPEYVVAKEHKERIDAVIDYILKNINEDVSLKALANVANYSVFHLQKLFLQVVGESPKKYITRLRLETTLHLMIIHPQKSIQEITIDCGFSSPAVFSRAVRNYLGVSPEQFRNFSQAERTVLFRKKYYKAVPFEGAIDEFRDDFEKQLDIRIHKIETIRGVYMIAPFNEEGQIQQSFAEIIRLAGAHDLPFGSPAMYGILSPHQGNIYMTFIALKGGQPISNKFNVTEIKAGKYASFSVKGSTRAVIKPAQFFYNKWLPDNGYKLAGVVGFEQFSERPDLVPYESLNRMVFIPIEPV